MTQLDVEKLKEKLKQLLKEKFTVEKAANRTYTVADLYAEAAKLVRSEMTAIKSRPLTAPEESKLKELAKVISQTVLKEMKIA